MAARAFPPDDPVDAIMAVMERAFDPAFGEAWNRRQVSDAILLGTSRYALIDRTGTVGEQLAGPACGFYLARGVLDEVELLLFGIVPERRGRGLGAALLARFLDDAAARGARRVFLEMRRDNPAARLYEANGFKIVGARPAYYRGEDGARFDAVSYERLLD